jgi:DNA-binding NtrC family response regulator
MGSLSTGHGLADELLSGNQARVLLVNKDPQDLFHYRALLQDLGCQVRASSSFAEGMQCLGQGPFDLILLDQGSGRFEGQKLLAQAMEVDVELRVLVLARSYDRNCFLQAMQSGALDYLEGPLGAAEITALLETFIPRRDGVRWTSANRVKGTRRSKKASETGERYESDGAEQAGGTVGMDRFCRSAAGVR